MLNQYTPPLATLSESRLLELGISQLPVDLCERTGLGLAHRFCREKLAVGPRQALFETDLCGPAE